MVSGPLGWEAVAYNRLRRRVGNYFLVQIKRRGNNLEVGCLKKKKVCLSEFLGDMTGICGGIPHLVSYEKIVLILEKLENDVLKLLIMFLPVKRILILTSRSKLISEVLFIVCKQISGPI